MPRVCSFCMSVVLDHETKHPCDEAMREPLAAQLADHIAEVRAYGHAAHVETVSVPGSYLGEVHQVVTTAFPVWLQRAAYIVEDDVIALHIGIGDGEIIEASMTDEECANVIDALTQLRRRRQQAASVLDVQPRQRRS
jgi:hypothetical protein